MNYVRTAMLLALLTAIFVALGAGRRRPGRHGDRLLHRARHEPVQPTGTPTRWCCACTARGRSTSARRPSYYGIVRELAQRAGLPMPRVYVMNKPAAERLRDRPQPEHAAVCASTGLLEMLSREELTGVLAHELTPRQEPRHADHDGGRHHRRRHLHARAVSCSSVSCSAATATITTASAGSARCSRSSSRRSPPCWCRWRSAARASTRPTAAAP